MTSYRSPIAGRLGASAAMALLVLTGCSQGGDQPTSAGKQTSSRGSSGGADSADPQCALLNAKEIRSLVGKPLEGQGKTLPGSEIRACLYGELTAVGVQVAKVSADDWAKALPTFAEQLKANGAMGSKEALAQLEAAAKVIEQGKSLPPGEACEFFSRLIEAQNQPPDTHSITTYLPTANKPLAISAQSCQGDTYASLLVTRPDITPGGELELLITQTLQRLNPEG